MSSSYLPYNKRHRHLLEQCRGCSLPDCSRGICYSVARPVIVFLQNYPMNPDVQPALDNLLFVLGCVSKLTKNVFSRAGKCRCVCGEDYRDFPAAPGLFGKFFRSREVKRLPEEITGTKGSSDMRGTLKKAGMDPVQRCCRC